MLSYELKVSELSFDLELETGTKGKKIETRN